MPGLLFGRILLRISGSELSGSSKLGRSRASEDAKRYVHKRRLPLLLAEDHARYIELECIRMVEFLRAFRDEYRQFLQRQTKRSVEEIHWRVFRFGVKEIATYVLRTAAFGYMRSSEIPLRSWSELFEHEHRMATAVLPTDPGEFLFVQKQQVNDFRPVTVFDPIRRGGPFGPEGQVELAHCFPLTLGGETLENAIQSRQQLWIQFRPWTDGLARLFDAVQEELLFQHDALGEDGKRAEAALVRLSPFEKIVHRYLLELRSANVKRSRLGDGQWLPLLRELDGNEIALNAHLPDKPLKVARSMRQKGIALNTWEEAYISKGRTLLEDDKIHSILRAVTHAIHNAAKNASIRLERVWAKEKAGDY